MANSFISKVRNRLAAALATKPEQKDVSKSTEYRRPDVGSGFSAYLRSKQREEQWFFSNRRADKYDKYRYLDDQLAEASAALNVYADNVVSGSIGGDENYRLVVDKNTPNVKRVEEVVQFSEQRSGVKDQVRDLVRNTMRDGDLWTENVFSQSSENGLFYLLKLKPLPVKQIFADVDERGVFKDPEYPYYQRIGDEFGSDRDVIKFEDWRITHFKIGRDVYGVDHSIFAKAPSRIGRQLLWIDESLVLARLSRAYQRLAYYIDTTGLSPEEKWAYVRKWAENMTKRDIVDRSTGRVDRSDAPPLPDEDIFLPIDENVRTKQGIEVISGDMNLGRIDDVKYLENKFLMSVNVPKAYVSLEEGTRSKATLTQIDVQFARQVRRVQRIMIPGLRKVYETIFYLNGIDPHAFKWDIVFPAMGTMDEMLKWEMLQVKAQVAKILASDIGAVNTRWVLEYLLEMSEKEIEKYSFLGPMTGVTEYEQLPPEVADRVRKDPQVRQILTDLKELLVWKMSYDQKMKDMDVVNDDNKKKDE